MKILYLSFDSGISYWGTKGASIHIREFTKALRQSGHQVTTMVARMGEEKKVRDVHELPSVEADFFHGEENATPVLSEAKAFARNFGLKKLLKKLPVKKFNLVYERYSLFGVAGLSWAREHKLPFVLEVNAPLLEEAKTHRQLALEPLAKSVEEYLFVQADHIVTVSEAVRDYVCSVARRTTVSVVPNGVDVKPFLHSASTNDAGRRKKEFRVGFVGSLKPWHGLEYLLEAFRRLPENENFRLVIVGEGPLGEQLKKEAARLGLKEKVDFTGAVPYEKIPALLKSLDALAAPYPKINGFYFSPLKIFEYMAAGKPIVASRIGQVAQILENEKTALLVSPENPDELAAALRRLKSEHRLAKRLGLEAQKTAREKHTWKERLKIIEPIFRSLAVKKK